MRRWTILSITVSVLIPSAIAQANTWCDQTFGDGTAPPIYVGECTSGACVGGINNGLECTTPAPCGAFFCDDFDRYCIDAPPAPQECPTGASSSVGQLRSVWVRTSARSDGVLCGTEFTFEESEDLITSDPYGGKYPCQADAQLGQSTVGLAQNIYAHLGIEDVDITGTDDEPTILQFNIGGHVKEVYHMPYDTGYMELAYGLDHAPMDYIKVGADDGTGCKDCDHTCPSPQHSVPIAWPHVCQSYEPRVASPACPPLETNIRAALAIGANALLDNDPCHCDYGTPTFQVPTNYHLSYYDGLKWRILKSGSYGGGTGYGDFVLGAPYNTVRLTIRATTVDIYLYAKEVYDPATQTWVEQTSEAFNVPRLYTGSFDRLRGGAAHACELSNTSYTCVGNTRCTRVGDWSCDGTQWVGNNAGAITFDNVSLYGGLGSSTDGACCDNDGNCSITTYSNCIALGYIYKGKDIACDTNTCCPQVWADADRDGDVDQIDFAAFQLCFSGDGITAPAECHCWDRDTGGDGDVDADDYSVFNTCWTGPNVPYNLGSLPTGCE